ncbi:iron chelate uptake ABC transporter family permease subunit [Desulfovirgula thermocuniculi]|uniref:iron chelate uptake ABC transporter family permease subunit n=1 Tax=Desulfovirgula thermocuniculi TaxID=348842 RepID=UPI001B7FC330|nr:iron chelate uptake ABC transporter family permease subunit [Desulfovirgula thermocuniculi]
MVPAKYGRHTVLILTFAFAAGLLLLLNLSLGPVPVPFGEVVRLVLHRPVQDATFQTVIWQIRLPRSLATLFGGAALATAGLLLQVFFRNPIVGPYVLGISSGATLLVGLVMLTGFYRGVPLHPLVLSVAAFLGALGVMVIVLAVAARMKNVVTLLVIGLMMGYLCSAVSSILIALAEKERVHGFVLWTLGSFSGFTREELAALGALTLPYVNFFFFTD